MKKLSKQQLQDAAKPYFEKYPEEKVMLATHDGMFFTSSSRNAAVNHARYLKGELTVIRRESDLPTEPKSDLPTDKMTVDEIKAWMQERDIDVPKDAKTKKQLIEAAAKAVEDSGEQE